MTTRSADKIAKELEHLVFTGAFSDGERLDEIKLSKRFGVSRTPIREAIQKLALSGLVVQEPRRGAFVHQPGPVELIQMFEFMAELESACGHLCAKRISDEALALLDAANEKCQIALDHNDVDLYYLENERFHHLIYKSSGNGFLEQEALRLHQRLKPYRRIQLHLRGRMKQSMEEHHEILKALSDGNGCNAAAALRGHVAIQGEKFHHLMASLKEKE
ncbi:GntR family transcriptional regulator [Pseudohalocynthiibacter aestuariivivens]|uniref:GntR family transcriptional regulator n=1 Tax=Roseovarius pelagicus TaxID=2980108 RepID=A0ABY6D9Q4_9RHOB|nr:MULTISPECIES: GntR family transcriptional regulator [Rhodobacterales]QIE45221.1 GntR family transcriptional regulator [Pseudohalocynthiibacter aestuariivivens]UXX82874.1 GntR family transcriptional regulator [Roseovarius pelagicus]